MQNLPRTSAKKVTRLLTQWTPHPQKKKGHSRTHGPKATPPKNRNNGFQGNCFVGFPFCPALKKFPMGVNLWCAKGGLKRNYWPTKPPSKKNGRCEKRCARMQTQSSKGAHLHFNANAPITQLAHSIRNGIWKQSVVQYIHVY